MQILVDIAAASLLLFGLLLLAAQFAALLIGWWFGHRHRPTDGTAVPEGVGVMVGALLGLLAFTLALAISIAESRFEARRQVALQEANAIGTAWLRAHAVGGPRGVEIARLLEEYTRTRITWLGAGHDSQALATSTVATGAAQALLWGHVTAIVRERADPLTLSLLTSLNETFDLATSQRVAFLGQIPSELPWLLLGIAMLSVGSLGYQAGLRGRLHPLFSLLLLGAWSSCMVLIADLANPRLGWVRVDPAPYVWTLESFAGGASIPPAPVR